jgi:hypothetical protein
MYLFVSVESDGVGSFLNQTLIRVALVLTSQSFEVLSLESFFVKGATSLGPAVPWYTLSQVNNGLQKRDAKSFIESRLTYLQKHQGRVVAHNLQYVLSMLVQLGVSLNTSASCTMKLGAPVCKLMPVIRGQHKYPQLSELSQYLLGTRDVGLTAEEKAYSVKQCYQAMHTNKLLY